jgi:hypothetical protein
LLVPPAAQALVSASAVTPIPIVPGDRCFRCQRVIADRWVAAELAVQQTNVIEKFRTIRCMVTHLTVTRIPTSHIYVTDQQTGQLIDIKRATFVPVAIDSYTGFAHYGLGTRDYVAYHSAEAAERRAATQGVTSMSWAEVLWETVLFDDVAPTIRTGFDE